MAGSLVALTYGSYTKRYTRPQVLLGCILAYYLLAFILLCLSLHHSPLGLDKRSWGGFDERPDTVRCYRQERTAMILAVFLGPFGVDQWYAHHYVLALFKLLTAGGFGIWAFVDC